MAGGLPVGWTGHDDDLARNALIDAHEAGITHWDTADVYGDGRAERLIGSMWGEVPRDDIFLATKVGWDPGPYGHYYHPQQIRAQFQRSLANLAVDYVDLYYLHHCDFGPEGEYLDDALEVVRGFRDEGAVRFIGLSDWDCSRVLEYADTVNPDAVQIYRNVVDDSFESSGLRAWTDKHDVGAAFFSPLRHGLLLGKYDAPTTFGEGDFRNQVDEFRDAEVIRTMRRRRDELQRRFGWHPESVLYGVLGSLLADSSRDCVLVGMRSPEQVRAAATVSELMPLDDARWVQTLYRESTSAV